MLAPLLVLIAACTQPSTLSQPGQETNHAEVSALSVAPPDLTSAVDPEQALFTYVDARAQALASREYEPPPQILPAALATLTYEQYRAIQFRQEMSLWQDEHRFTVQVLHPGFLYTEPVEIHLVQDTDVERLPFMQARYRYVGPAAPVADQITGDIGHAGFRVYYTRGGPDNREEVAVFLGASYFRLVGHQQVHGLSARGLAVDAGLDSGEEFPAFRTFWLIQPDPEATQLTFFALLDSPSVTGAYRFELDPARHTTLTVDAHLYARHDVTKLGVAPMSSMFLYGPNRLPAFDDFRPQVHDSDGVLMHTARDEWIWRPLNNGPGLRITSLRDDTPQGFGLVQRERQFASYLDLQARYHQRPSYWVEVGEGAWGRGGVELLAIPTNSEFNDNIATYWVPDAPFNAGDMRQYQYRLRTFDSRLATQTLAHVVRTRIGWDALPNQHDPPPRSQRRFIVDFAGEVMPGLDPIPTSAIHAVLDSSTGQTTDPIVQRLPDGQSWRVSFVLSPAGDLPADMRLYLAEADHRVSETWNYVWYPDHIN